MTCPSFSELASGVAEVAPEHLAACSPCAEAAQDLRVLRAEARNLGPAAWGPRPPAVDTDAALQALWEQADAFPRRRSPGRLLQLTSRAAAALLIAGLGAPYVLEARKARAPKPSPTPLADADSVFWTHPGGVLAARK